MLNLAPADRKKEGSSYDLAIIAAILQSDGVIPHSYDFSDKCLLGELSLSGEVRAIGGILPMAISARDAGRREIFVPFDNAKEAAVVEGITVYGVKSLRALVNHIKGKEPIAPTPRNPMELIFPMCEDSIRRSVRLKLPPQAVITFS